MIKLVILIIVGIGAVIAWLRLQWAVDKNKRAANKIVVGLKNGTYDAGSFEESLNMLIRTRPLPAQFDAANFGQKIAALTNTRLAEKFRIQHAAIEPSARGIIIAEGIVKDVLASSKKEVEVTYPCWLHVSLNTEKQEIYFKSSMPDGKDHHHLLEDISDAIHERCVR